MKTVIAKNGKIQLEFSVPGDIPDNKEEMEVIMKVIAKHGKELYPKALKQDSIIGKKVREGGKIGHEAAHGTEDEKQKRWAKYQKDVDELHAKLLNLKYSAICYLVAKRNSVVKKTIMRHTHCFI